MFCLSFFGFSVLVLGLRNPVAISMMFADCFV